MLNPECIEFREEGHRYIHKPTGRDIPSVTQILGILDTYKGIDKSVLNYAAERGRAVHTACQLWDEDDLDLGSLDPVIRPYVHGWIMFRDDTGFKRFPGRSECMIFHEHLGYAGRFDCIGEYPDKTTDMPDIKTQSDPTPDYWGMQLAAYAEALPADECPKRRSVVHLRDDGTYRYYKLNEPHHWRRFKVVFNYFNLRQELNI